MLITSAVLLFGGGCKSTPADHDTNIFEHAEDYLGQELSVVGVLRFEPGNHNLFPSRDARTDWESGKCLPVGIAKTDTANAELATALDKRRVRVTGTIQDLIAPNHVNLSFCKEIGISVTSITAQ